MAAGGRGSAKGCCEKPASGTGAWLPAAQTRALSPCPSEEETKDMTCSKSCFSTICTSRREGRSWAGACGEPSTHTGGAKEMDPHVPASSQAPHASLPPLQGSVPHSCCAKRCHKNPEVSHLLLVCKGGACHVSQLFPVTRSSRGGSREPHAEQHVLSHPLRAPLPAALEVKRPTLHNIFPPF